VAARKGTRTMRARRMDGRRRAAARRGCTVTVSTSPSPATSRPLPSRSSSLPGVGSGLTPASTRRRVQTLGGGRRGQLGDGAGAAPREDIVRVAAPLKRRERLARVREGELVDVGRHDLAGAPAAARAPSAGCRGRCGRAGAHLSSRAIGSCAWSVPTSSTTAPGGTSVATMPRRFPRIANRSGSTRGDACPHGWRSQGRRGCADREGQAVHGDRLGCR
jgi:hypothetical protein